MDKEGEKGRGAEEKNGEPGEGIWRIGRRMTFPPVAIIPAVTYIALIM